ncbi:MAG TPA: hypothetical protein VK508_14435 [Cyclobacteriaceae bacterium]|nr:hypothetical protein [Cyclobacteriaceae bacterium]
MKTSLGVAGKLLLLLLAASVVRCSDVCTVTNKYYYMSPTYMTLDKLRASVRSEAPQELVQAGKIYFKDNYLYVNEMGKGVHVIDNHDPSNPVHRSFINIPGNYDLAIYGNILYADSYVDLVAIDVSVPGQEHEVTRYKEMFSFYSNMRFTVSPEKGVIVGMSVAEEIVVNDGCNTAINTDGWGYYNDGLLMSYTTYSTMQAQVKAPASVAPGNSAGIGGSMARFTITADHLYALDYQNLHVVNVTNPAVIDWKKKVAITWDVETIFPYNENLFLGSQSGMHIYDISTADDPKMVTTFSHMKSCDPVVVDGEYAYVTLRTESFCAGNINELQVIDIGDINSPTHVSTFKMTNPHGLGIDHNVLFICDGSDGLKVYDATDKGKIDKNLKAHYKDIRAFDIIPFNNIAMMIAEDGLYQYDYSDLQKIRLLSKIDIKQVE